MEYADNEIYSINILFLVTVVTWHPTMRLTGRALSALLGLLPGLFSFE